MSSVTRQDLQSAQLILVSLKRDHEQALDALNALAFLRETSGSDGLDGEVEVLKSFNAEKIPIIKSALSRIQDGLDESEVLLTFAKYLECLEAELMKLRLHNQRLCEETSWLRDELKHTQGKLNKSESLLAQAISDKQHLTFLSDLNKLSDSHTKNESTRLVLDTPESSLPSRPFMSSSVAELPGLSKHSVSSPSPSNSGVPWHSRDYLAPPMICSQTVDVSSLMNSSMIDADLNMWSYTQSFHPSLLGTSEPKANKTSSAVPPSLRTLHRIVVQYTNQGKHEVAAALCVQAIGDLDRAGGRDQAEIAVLLNILALVYRDQGKYNEASDLLKNVVAIRERLFGQNNPLVAASLNNLAVLHAKAGRFDEAEPFCRRALAIREKLLGPNHLDVAKQLNNLALLCQNQGRFEEVESCLRRALEIYLELYKPSSPIVLRAKNNLASALLKRGNLSGAEDLLKSVLSPDHPSKGPSENVNSLPSTKPSNPTEVDSAVFSTDGSYNGFPTGDPEQAPTHFPVPPLWFLVEQAGREGRSQLSRLTRFDLAAWASEAHIDMSIVLSAIRNLAIIYQRQGQIVQANLLRSWIQPHSANRVNTPASGNSLSPELAKPTILKELTASTCLPQCSSPNSNFADHCFH